MIPDYKIKIVQTLNPKLLRLPSKKLIECEDGLVSNHDYVNPTTYTWYDFEEINKFEKKIIAKAKKSETIDEFLDILIDSEDDCPCGTLADIGVSGIAIALVNSGYIQNKNQHFQYNCIPITSSAGSNRLTPSYRGERGFYPYVAGFASPMFGEKLLALVKDKNIGLMNVKFVEGLGFALYAQNIEELFNFGKFLYEQREM